MRGVVFIGFVVACGPNAPTGIDKLLDLSVGGDLLMADLFSCGTRSDTGLEAKAVMASMTAPQDRMQFALDLNGDGKADNQYGNIVGALRANLFDGQLALTAAVESGQNLQLIHLTAADFTDDPCVTARLLRASQQPNPNFSGIGSFTVDGSFAPAPFPGAIASAAFQSSGDQPVAVSVQLPFATVMVPITLIGAHLKFSLSPSSGLPMSGQLNGAIKGPDLASTFIPGAAQLLNNQVTSNPGSNDSKNLLLIFDIGCTGNAALKGDGQIATCEVADNAIIKNVLNPDVQLFDANGEYRPNPDNTKRDSLSVGLAFTAVGASF